MEFSDGELLLLRVAAEQINRDNPGYPDAMSLHGKVERAVEARGLDHLVVAQPDDELAHLPEWARARCMGWTPNLFGGADTPGACEWGRAGLRLAFDADGYPTLFRFEGQEVVWSAEFGNSTPSVVMAAALDAAIAEVACPSSMVPVVAIATFASPGLTEAEAGLLALSIDVQVSEPAGMDGERAEWEPKQVSVRVIQEGSEQ